VDSQSAAGGWFVCSTSIGAAAEHFNTGGHGGAIPVAVAGLVQTYDLFEGLQRLIELATQQHGRLNSLKNSRSTISRP
jgi:hypothetical protein